MKMELLNMCLGRFFPPNDRNACRNHNQGKNCKETWIKVHLLLEHNNDLSANCFCYHEGYTWLYMSFGENLFFQMKKSSRNIITVPKLSGNNTPSQSLEVHQKSAISQMVLLLGKLHVAQHVFWGAFSPK